MPTKKMKSGKKAKKPARGTARAKTTASRAPAKRGRPLRTGPETLRLRAAAPSFTVDDIEKSLAWYRDVLGFVVKDRMEEGGKLAGAELLAGSVTFWIGQDDWKKGRDRAKGEGFRLYCETAQDVDRLAERIEARGGRLAERPTDQSWGMRQITVVDPDGFKITIVVPKKK
jgi:uncharacterized glyoxalase superfamily protein PhnB